MPVQTLAGASVSDAGLVRQFDPLEALSGLGTALGKTPSDKKRLDALNWAFRVWDAAGKNAETAVKDADLHVPTIGGWVPADKAVFSGTWIEIGKRVEAFLSEASELSRDCRHARNQLLKPLSEWSLPIADKNRKWRGFLELLGVTDGLKPIASGVQQAGPPSYYWKSLLRNGDASRGLTRKWAELARQTHFQHPNTPDYTLKGEFWRLPGQIEYNKFPDHLREAFYELLVHHLACHRKKFLFARVGRYSRSERDWDEKHIVTPLGAFLRSAEWMQADLRGERMFIPPSECWASKTRRPGVPAFIPRLSDDARVLVDQDEVAKITFGEGLRLLDWSSPETAARRLVAMANCVEKLQSGDIATFRRQYSRAWGELAERQDELPPNLPLAVHRFENLTRIEGDEGAQTKVVLAKNAHDFEARALVAAGMSVLELGEVDLEVVEKSLGQVDAYSVEKLDRDSVRLLVDGSVFVPATDDEYLVSVGLDWLPEIAVIANEVIGENLERGILTTTLDRRIRSIRVRRCKSIALTVAGQEVANGSYLQWYAYRDGASPTLILTDGITIDWPRLAKGLAAELSKLIDTRLRSLELALLRLAPEHPDGSLERPTDTKLASALGCDVRFVEDMRAGMRTDLAHSLHLIIPVVAYFESVELARDLADAAKDQGAEFSLQVWLETHLSMKSPTAADLLAACKNNPDRRLIATALDLQYGQFNRVLLSLGEETLSNDAELRATFEAYLREMAPELRDRLRKLHLEDYRLGEDLSTYVSRRELKFIPFDPAWIVDFETLDRQMVVEHVETSFAEAFGMVPQIELPPFEKTIGENRKVVRAFAGEAKPVIGAWCRKNHIDLPDVWERGEAQEVVRLVENAGLIDFDAINSDRVAVLCRRTGIWPEEMPAKIDPESLGLDESAVREEQVRKVREQQERDRRKRIIQFAGQDLDSGDPSFAATMQNIAEAAMASDDSWFARSRQRTKLVPFDEALRTDSNGGNGGGGKRGQRTARLTETQKVAMGVASEWLAYQLDFVQKSLKSAPKKFRLRRLLPERAQGVK